MAKKLIKLTESDLERIVSKVIQEQTLLGTLANVGEIGVELANSIVNSVPIVSVANMVKSAASGDANSLSQVIDQEKARLGQNYQTLKNSITKGDVSKNLSNLATFLSQASQPFVSQMKSGLGNKPATSGIPATKKTAAPVGGGKTNKPQQNAPTKPTTQTQAGRPQQNVPTQPTTQPSRQAYPEDIGY